MKTKLRTIGFIVIAVIFVGLIANVIRSVLPEKPKAPIEETPIIYSIAYRGVMDGELAEIDSCTYKDDANYPTTYTTGEIVYIDDLKKYSEPNEDEYIFFDGWYTDFACTVGFDGTLPADQTGNVVLYAKLSVHSSWTKNY